jgi:hypothetical protein
MQSQQIREITSWIQTHSEHVYESDGEDFEGLPHAQAWFKFCQDPTLVNEYEDPMNYRMLSRPQASNGCIYIFSKGTCKGMRCNCPLDAQSNRCAFHNHAIFSAEVREYLQNEHANINGRPAERAQSNTMSVIQVEKGLYYETTHRVALKQEQERWTCVGYFKESSPVAPKPSADDILPLTSQLQAWCQKQGLICV